LAEHFGLNAVLTKASEPPEVTTAPLPAINPLHMAAAFAAMGPSAAIAITPPRTIFFISNLQ
jgi:hypothetical protein